MTMTDVVEISNPDTRKCWYARLSASYEGDILKYVSPQNYSIAYEGRPENPHEFYEGFGYYRGDTRAILTITGSGPFTDDSYIDWPHDNRKLEKIAMEVAEANGM